MEVKILVKYTYKDKNYLNFNRLLLRVKTLEIIHMNQADIIRLVGQYITFEEFNKNCSEINIDRNEWYRLLDGNTYRENKTQLKTRYLKDFDDDWESNRKLAFNIIKNEKTSD